MKASLVSQIFRFLLAPKNTFLEEETFVGLQRAIEIRWGWKVW